MKLGNSSENYSRLEDEHYSGVGNDVDNDFERKKKPFDYGKFEALSKSPEIKSWLDKISSRCGKQIFKEEWATFGKQNLFDSYMKMMKQCPGILPYIHELWLNTGEADFSKLSGEQKITYTALYRTFNWTWRGFKPGPRNLPSNKDKFWTAFNSELEGVTQTLNINFKLENLTNFGRLKTTLKEYGLTESEIEKFTEYMSMLKDYPEAIEVQKAGGFWAGIIVGMIIMAIIAGLGFVVWNNYRKKKEVPIVEKITIGKIDKIDDIRETLDVWLRKFSTKCISEGYAEYPNAGDFTNFWRRQKNKLVYQDIEMEVTGEFQLYYDLKNAVPLSYYVYRDKNWKDRMKAYLHIPEYPKVALTGSKANIIEKKTWLINSRKFNQQEQELRESIEKDMVEQAMLTDDYKKLCQEAKISLEAFLRPYLKAGYNMEVIGFVIDVGEKKHEIDPKTWEITPIINIPKE